MHPFERSANSQEGPSFKAPLTDRLQSLSRAAVNAIPGADMASLTVVDQGHTFGWACSDCRAERIADLQRACGQGPSLDAAAGLPVVRSDDLAADNRWPDFAPEAARQGVAATLSVTIDHGGDCLGALTVYAAAAGAFVDHDVRIAGALATAAAAAITAWRDVNYLRAGMRSRDIIGQAKGILIERLKVGPDKAFLLLVRASQDTHRKVHGIAEDLVLTGEWPPQRARTPRSRGPTV